MEKCAKWVAKFCKLICMSHSTNLIVFSWITKRKIKFKKYFFTWTSYISHINAGKVSKLNGFLFKHDDVIKCKHFPRYWPFVRGIRRGPTQRPVTLSFDVFFDLRLNKRLSKRWWGWWFETLSHPLWRHRNELWHDDHIIVVKILLKLSPP